MGITLCAIARDFRIRCNCTQCYAHGAVKKSLSSLKFCATEADDDCGDDKVKVCQSWVATRGFSRFALLAPLQLQPAPQLHHRHNLQHHNHHHHHNQHHHILHHHYHNHLSHSTSSSSSNP